MHASTAASVVPATPIDSFCFFLLILLLLVLALLVLEVVVMFLYWHPCLRSRLWIFFGFAQYLVSVMCPSLSCSTQKLLPRRAVNSFLQICSQDAKMAVDGPMFAKRSRPFGSSSSSVVPMKKNHRKCYKGKRRDEEAGPVPRTQPTISDGSSVEDSLLHRDNIGEYDQYDQQVVDKKLAKKLRKLEKKAKKRELKAKMKLQGKVEKARLKLERKARRQQRKLERKAASDLAEYERWANSLRRPISFHHNSRSGSMLAIGGDSLVSILSFLDMKDLALVELVCVGMRNEVQQRYESIDAQIKSNKSRAKTAKMRAIRLHLASTYAKKMEPLVPRHLASTEDESDHICTGDRCQFPSSLFTNPSPDTHELFVRFAKSSENNSAGSPQLIVEGFTKFVLDGSRIIFDIGAMDLSTFWPDMRTIIDWSNDCAPPFIHLILKSLVATVVAVPKKGGEAVSLVNGTHNDPTDPHLDHYHLPTGSHSYCTTNDLRTAPHSRRCNVTFNWEFVWSNGGTLECHLTTLR